ncbi:MAG: archease [Planctomycetota bacterium]
MPPLKAMYELFDHTADLGVRVQATSLPELIPPATDGFYATIGVIHVGKSPDAARSLEFTGNDPALLLRDYLAELLNLFETEQRRLIGVRVHEFTPERLAVSGQAQPVDRERSSLRREVKAVTYHELAVRQTPGGYEATYIVDI